MKPNVFAAVMATGIVSVAAADHGLGVISAPLAALALLALPVLMYLISVRWHTFDMRDIDTVMALYTYVAACSVLTARFAERAWSVWVFGPLALTGWLSLGPLVIRRMRRLGLTGLRDRARGLWELASVATSGLAIVFTVGGVLFWAFTFWALALCLYAGMTSLVAWRALTEPGVRRNVPADHWILMGAAAIATLAGEHIHSALHPGPAAHAVLVVTVVTWGVATVQIAPLALTGWRQLNNWPAVFPLGMYSAASFAVAIETGWHALVVVSQVFFGIAFAAWLLTAATRVRR
ncbi:tellurite resistance/C4-dicarboxylate transporter family protein [Mycolicibacterium goodii]|uniref:tellurite resistance/C4-dicarboxylate transporter family protein n=1 Tax=Mycolicibacterium goodii TaxID=134601 RepID=UPI001BDC672A|nr:tellurite resistance/C4-dicarboxylate transporter family protein [Mycolicibacterium goodii]MBU8831572.1 tellurite resistance/C4-dicarboxylate transporter family protein [Mycolicibacterium goodii]